MAAFELMWSEARLDRDSPKAALWHVIDGRLTWEVDQLEDDGRNSAPKRRIVKLVSEAVDAVNHRVSQWKRNASRTSRKPVRTAFFELPAELRMLIYELYWYGVTQTSTRKQYRYAVLKPQLISRQFAAECMDTWPEVLRIDLPRQQIEWQSLLPPRYREFRLDTTIQRLFFLVRDWLTEVPHGLRRRLRNLRVSYVSRDNLYENDSAVIRALQRIRGRALARLMERLHDVHAQLRIEVRIFVVVPRARKGVWQGCDISIETALAGGSSCGSRTRLGLRK